MKLALKYGLPITLVVVGWIVFARFLLNVGSDSKLNFAAPFLFNVAEFLFIYLGIRERKRQTGDSFTFKDGLKSGVLISLVYAISACLFFVIEFFIAGPALMMSETTAHDRPLWQLALMAYAGLFFGALIFGIIYSALSAFVVARQRAT